MFHLYIHLDSPTTYFCCHLQSTPQLKTYHLMCPVTRVYLSVRLTQEIAPFGQLEEPHTSARATLLEGPHTFHLSLFFLLPDLEKKRQRGNGRMEESGGLICSTTNILWWLVVLTTRTISD